MKAHGLQTAVPIYVTRKNADGETGSYYLSLWMSFAVILLAWLNIIAWGSIGLVAAVLWVIP